MRHNTFGRKLGRTTAHRLAMFRNQIASLVAHERIITTIAKAKELRPIAERVVTQSRSDTVHARRLVSRWLPDRDLIKRLFDEIAPRFSTRPGGYLRIVRLGSRQGDGAELAVLEFVDFKLKKAAGAAPVESKGKKGRDSKAPEPEAAATSAKSSKPEKKSKPAASRAGMDKGQKKAAAKGEARVKPAKAPAAAKRSSAPKKAGSS